MSQISKLEIKCKRGHTSEVDAYTSVNVTTDSELKEKVRKKDVNWFKCSQCGEIIDLVYHFLYADLEKKIWIWCFPEFELENRKEIEKEYTKMSEKISGFFKMNLMFAFGYDELFELINHHS